jgi:glycogen(starch) synthase
LRLVGQVPPDQIFEFFRSHDLLVHLSEYETFGMTVVEAVSAGIPVLVTRCGGPDETLAGISALAGATVEVGNTTEDVVSAYRELAGRVDDLDLEEARRALTARYSLEAVGAVIAHHYEAFGAEVGRQ